MFTIIFPEGSFRGHRVNQFLGEAQSIFKEKLNVISLKDFLKNGLSDNCKICMPRIGSPSMSNDTLELLKSYENNGVKIYPNTQSIVECGDKDLFYKKCLQNDIPIPKTTTLNLNESIDYTKINIPKPWIIKPVSGSGGNDIFKINSIKELEDFLSNSEYISNTFKNKIILQEYIETIYNYPNHIRLYVLNNNLVCGAKFESSGKYVEGSIVEKSKSIFVNKKEIHQHKTKLNNQPVSNVGHGGYVLDHKVTKLEEKIALKVADIFDIEFTAIDIMYDKNNNLYVLEANISPHVYQTVPLYNIHFPKMIYNFLQEKYEI